MKTLVLAGPVAEIGGRAVAGDGTLADSRHRRGVVGPVNH